MLDKISMNEESSSLDPRQVDVFQARYTQCSTLYTANPYWLSLAQDHSTEVHFSNARFYTEKELYLPLEMINRSIWYLIESCPFCRRRC